MIFMLKNTVIGIIIYTSLFQLSFCVLGPCKSGLIRRKNKNSENVCCHPTVCAPAHMYEFCQEENGFDVCKSCPAGTYHNDVIHTAKMPYVIDPCVSIVTCDQPEVRLLDGRCICDRQKGYFGTDPHNCMLSEFQCSGPGYELSNNGKCEPCEDNFFKPQSDHKYLCQEKTSCSENQIILSNGSNTEDRKCKEKEASVQNLPLGIHRADGVHATGLQEIQRLKKELRLITKKMIRLRKRIHRLEKRERKRRKRRKRKNKNNGKRIGRRNVKNT